MNSYSFLMHNGTIFVDITKLVQTNVNIQDKLDLTLDFGSFTLPHVKASYESIDGIDFSKPIILLDSSSLFNNSLVISLSIKE